MVDNLSYNDTHEGIDAFLNKRKPQFKEWFFINSKIKILISWEIDNLIIIS